MLYKLEDLLTKMGTPEVGAKNRVEWHYFDAKRRDLAGIAEVRLENGGRRLVADLRHTRENYEDDHGGVHVQFTETFHLVAERAANGDYSVEKVAFDGVEYRGPSPDIVTLALSIFHARALDISIAMVEQIFNKQDVTEPASELEFPQAPRAIFSRRPAPHSASFGVVIPFRPRAARDEQRAANLC